MGLGFSKLFPLIWDSILPSDYSTYQKSLHSGIVIALVGRSGSGMSKFIHDATGSYKTGVTPEGWRETNNKPYKPYTTVIQDFGFTIPGIDYADFPLLFIDTPGFDYTTNNDEHTTLQKLSVWLQTYKPGMKLDGLIFMHSADADELQSRSPYVPRDKVIRELCGEDWQGKLLFLGTHWHSLDREHKESKEAAIRKYWSHMNSKTEQYDAPGYESAWKTLKPLVQKATTAREQRLKAELEDLKSQVSPGDIPCDRIRDILDKKMSFMQRVTANLGTLVTQSLTDAEKREYAGLNERARELWEEVEHQINGVELERLLNAGGNQESLDESIKVAVVGSTGSGISQFIYDVTGEGGPRIAPLSSLHPFTSKIEAFPCLVPAGSTSHHVTLIDTPGFDYADPQNDEYSRFRLLSPWFRNKYGLNARLDWVIYIHNIQNEELDDRPALHTCEPLKTLCGHDWPRQVIFVSSHWTGVQDEEREKEVKEGYWSVMLQKKSRLRRYNSSSDSYTAGALLQSILSE